MRARARETAALVACAKRALQSRWNAARLAPHVQWLPPGVLDDAHDARIARQSTHGVRRKVWAIVQMAATVAIKLGQCFSGNVYLDLGVGAHDNSVQQGIGA